MSTLKSSVQLIVKADLTQIGDLATAVAPMIIQRMLNLADGNGANQARVVFSDTRTLAPSTTEDIDLAGGGLLDNLGAVFAPVKIRAIIVIASPANVNNVVVGGDANSVPFLSAAATTIAIQPGGFFVLTAPATAGIAVTAGTGDIIQVANGGAGTSVTYDLIVIGTAA